MTNHTDTTKITKAMLIEAVVATRGSMTPESTARTSAGKRDKAGLVRLIQQRADRATSGTDEGTEAGRGAFLLATLPEWAYGL